MEVALPVLVIGPVRLAFVVTLVAVVALVALPERAPENVVAVRVPVLGTNVSFELEVF
jgi:hypothetical protein